MNNLLFFNQYYLYITFITLYYKRRLFMAKNKNQNRSKKAGKNLNNTNTTNRAKQKNTSANEVKPDDRPRRDGPGGN